MNPHAIIDDICRQHGLPTALLRSRRRTRRLVTVRRAVACALRQHGMSLGDIAELLGYANHTTVQHLLRTQSAPVEATYGETVSTDL